MTIRMILASASVLVALAGCGDDGQQPQRTRPTTPPLPVATVELEVQGCSVGPRGQADLDCDPGATNPEVTQSTIASTICVSGWTARVRPPTSYTLPKRNAEMWLYYPTSTPTTSVRYDHLIPLELGGSPRDLNNLWPQPVEPSYVKNTDGGRLKDQVCRREITLAEAQRQILERWTH